MSTKTLSVIEDKVMELLTDLRNGKRYGSHYFTVEGAHGEDVKIRVSDHSANRQNNGDRKTLSFITQLTEQRKSGYNRMMNEYVIDEDGYAETFESLSYILNEEIF